MATSQSTVHGSRPTAVNAATAALLVSAIVDFANLGGYLSGAPIPPVIVGVWVAIGLAALFTAGGLWTGRRRAARLAIALAAITVLLGIVGAVTADSATGKSVSAAGSVAGLAVIALAAACATRRTNG